MYQDVEIDYSNVSFHEMPDLKLAFQGEYIKQNDMDYKIDSISVRSSPLFMGPAIKTIIFENSKNNPNISKSYVERIALLFGVSKLSVNPIIEEIIYYDSLIMSSSDDEYLWESMSITTNKFNVCPCISGKHNYSSFAWVKQWICDNSKELGFTKSDFATFCLIHGLSFYKFKGVKTLQHIGLENDHFLNYLIKKNKKMKDFGSKINISGTSNISKKKVQK